RAQHYMNTACAIDDVETPPDLTVVARSDGAVLFLLKSKDDRHIMVTGHLEYDATTLRDEYERDIAKGVEVDPPENYFPDDDVTKTPLNTWRAHTHLLFSNWLNYYVYQETPYKWE